MRAQTHGVYFIFTLVGDPGFNHIFGENIAAQQEFVVSLEGDIAALVFATIFHSADRHDFRECHEQRQLGGRKT